MKLFSKESDYAAFEGLLEQTCESRSMRICAYCLMPNHWHFVLWPEHDGELAAFMQQLTTKHVRRWQLHRRRVGYGHVYQSRYKSFPVEEEEYFYQLVRYVERNALRADLVGRAEDWKWCSLWRRTSGTSEQKQLLSPWPVAYPRGCAGWSTNRRHRRRWRRFAAAWPGGSHTETRIGFAERPNDSDSNRPSVCRTVQKGIGQFMIPRVSAPVPLFLDPLFLDHTETKIGFAERLGLESTLRAPHRPKKVLGNS